MASNARRRGLLRLVLVGLLVLIGAAYVSPAFNFYTRSGEIEKERAANNDLQEKNRQLSQEKQRLEDGSYIEAVAREDLGLVKPGEQPYVVKDIDQQPVEPAVAPAPAAPAPYQGGLFPVFTSSG